MILGVGMDLVDIDRFHKMANENEWLSERLLTDNENMAFMALTHPHRRAEWLAGRFAAKEALMKALGLALPKGIGMRDIEVLPDHWGKPVIVLSQAVHRQMNVPYVCHLSITHTATTAGAVVVVEQRMDV
ncbi:holo-[acyl-carrier-protein] synthase [Paenibacillus rhizovicinus]|uniref:Holo-[acyl-carrier-protein] synthase n=1 Tax=Paenibacillus rhizovicinus TaxID=2704463 RepID=A0A6C0P1T9_9BACL|nr:holo-ACP synthase [Paenibacillus rhizovicinus]QHW32321.1 holo-[acyl-carrier-protein] synthase [Paenibacillus rhizovicinus]